MTRLYLWTVCAVALVGCHREPVDVSVETATNVWVKETEVNVTNGYVTNVVVSNMYITGIMEWVTNISIGYPDPWLNVTHNTSKEPFTPTNTFIEATHRPLVARSNNVWIIRFEP